MITASYWHKYKQGNSLPRLFPAGNFFGNAIITSISILERPMPKTQNRAVMKWLIIFAFIVAFLVIFGGFDRLTRSSLSIVEWNPVGGVVPPIGEQAWQAEFAKYQRTPEYQKINSG